MTEVLVTFQVAKSTSKDPGDCRQTDLRSSSIPQRDNPTGTEPVGAPNLPSYSFITAGQKKHQTEGLAEIAPDGFPPGRQSGTAHPPGLTYPERCVSPGLTGKSSILPSSRLIPRGLPRSRAKDTIFSRSTAIRTDSHQTSEKSPSEGLVKISPNGSPREAVRYRIFSRARISRGMM